MLILHDPATLEHKTVELLGAKLIPALESPERILAILDALKDSPHDVREVNSNESDIEKQVEQTHDREYTRHLKDAHGAWVEAKLIEADESILPECFPHPVDCEWSIYPKSPKDIYAKAGWYAYDMSTGIMSTTYTSAMASANLAFHGVQILTASSGADSPASVFALCRPPGHHCDTKRAGGYCYINNAIVAAHAFLQANTRTNVAILDIDFHHGNGTQDYFYDKECVTYVSIHGQDEYPYYTGASDERGFGPGLQRNHNIPIPTGSSLQDYLDALDKAVSYLTTPGLPMDFLIVSLGFDTFHLDPLGKFDIDTPDYETIAHKVRSSLPRIPALILLEGGYVLDKLGENVLSFLKGWEGTLESK